MLANLCTRQKRLRQVLFELAENAALPFVFKLLVVLLKLKSGRVQLVLPPNDFRKGRPVHSYRLHSCIFALFFITAIN